MDKFLHNHNSVGLPLKIPVEMINRKNGTDNLTRIIETCHTACVTG